MNPLALLDKLVNPLATLLEKPLMKKTLLLGFFMMVLSSVWANHVSIIPFNTGDTLSSSDLNTNFNGLAAGIDGNQSAISANDGNIATNSTDIGSNDGKISTNITNIGTNAGNITSNNTNIGTNTGDIKVNQGNISTNGNTISNVSDRVTNLESVRTTSVTYAAASFTPSDETLFYFKGYLQNGYTCIEPPSTEGTLIHSVTLPAGVVITRLDIRLYDNLNDAYIKAELKLIGLVVTTAESTITETGAQKTKTGPAITHTVSSGPIAYYWIEVFLSAASTSQLCFYSVTLHYEYSL